jgi:hypothetical protein
LLTPHRELDVQTPSEDPSHRSGGRAGPTGPGRLLVPSGARLRGRSRSGTWMLVRVTDAIGMVRRSVRSMTWSATVPGWSHRPGTRTVKVTGPATRTWRALQRTFDTVSEPRTWSVGDAPATPACSWPTAWSVRSAMWCRWMLDPAARRRQRPSLRR